MGKITTLAVAVPAFLLGALCAGLATRAEAGPARSHADYEYRVVDGEGSMNSFGSQGFEYVGESAATGPGGAVERRYTLRKAR